MNWVINALSCIFDNLAVYRSGLRVLKLRQLLARGQGLHVEGVIGVLGGLAESLGKTKEKRRGGQKPCVGMSLPGGQQAPAASWPVPSPPSSAARELSPRPQLRALCFREAGCAQGNTIHTDSQKLSTRLQ